MHDPPTAPRPIAPRARLVRVIGSPGGQGRLSPLRKTLLFFLALFVLSALLSVYALVAIRPLPRVLGFGLGAMVPTLLMMHFQWRAFGNPLSPGHLFVENPAFRAGHQEGFFGAESFHWDGAVSLLFDGRLGMFGTSPLLMLGLVGLLAMLVAPGAVFVGLGQGRAMAAAGAHGFAVRVATCRRAGLFLQGDGGHDGDVPALAGQWAIKGDDAGG